MKKLTVVIFGLSLVLAALIFAYAKEPDVDPPNPAQPIVLIETSMGEIKLRLEPEKAPITVYNFLDYANSGFYDGTIFHRAVKDFVIQGGGYTPNLKKKPGVKAPIPNEAANGLKNRRGTIAVARPVEINSATSEFFINLSDNRILNHKDDSIQRYGYAVFGRVIQGMDVVDRIAKVPTAKQEGIRFVPVEPVIIKSIRVISP